MKTKFQKAIKQSQFFTLANKTQENLLTEFENSASQSPNIFIESQTKYTSEFKKQFSVTYLKSEPMLNNIFPTNHKEVDLTFFNIALFMLSNAGADERKQELAKRIILESYDSSQKKHNLGKLKENIRNVINVAVMVAIYFGGVYLFMNDEVKAKIFNNEENIRIEDKYESGSLDSYFFDKFASVQKEVNEDMIINMWDSFILASIAGYGETVEGEEITVFENVFQLLTEKNKEEITLKMCHLLHPFNLFESFLTMYVPKFESKSYRVVS